MSSFFCWCASGPSLCPPSPSPHPSPHPLVILPCQRLNLAETGVTDAGMATLATMTRLKDLNLFFCSVKDQGLSCLSTLTGLTRLNLDTK